MNRRDLLKLGVTSAAAPAVAGAQQAPAPAKAKPAAQTAAAWTPDVFDAHQNETVIALADLIIPETDTPGAKAAQVNRYLDLILRDGPAESRVAFLEGLGWLDGYAIREHRQPFVKCTAEQQTALLTTLDRGSEPGTEPGQRFFRLAKRTLAGIYYRTEIGVKELNKGGRVPSTFACQHSSHA